MTVMAGLLASSSAQASPEWVPTLTFPAGASFPSAAMAPDGTLTVVWTQMVGSARSVVVATRPPGGVFSGGLSLEDAPVTGGQTVATGRNGSVAVAWVQQMAGESERIAASFRTATGDWSPAQTLSANGQNASLPQLAVMATGEVAAVWVRNKRIQAARRTTSGVWTQPEDISALEVDASSPRVAVDTSGNSFAIWLQRGPLSNFDAVAAARRQAGGVWIGEPPLTTTDDSYASGPSLAVGATGRVAAIWNRPFLRTVFAAFRTGLGSWGPPQAVGPVSAFEDPPAISVDDQGLAVALVTDGGSRMRSVKQAPGGTWNAEPELIFPSANDTYSPRLAANFGGGAIGAWRSETRTSGPPPGPPVIITSHVLAVARLPGGAWRPLQSLASGTTVSSPIVTADNQGNGAVLWVEDGRIKVRGYDAGGPDLFDLRMPAGAIAGTTIDLSVGARDRWSQINSTTWDFGDGQGATGLATSHTFRDAGTYLVRVRSEDVLGNASTTERTVTVAPAPAADKDGDGQPPPDDCDDLDPRRRKGFVEQPGNTIDEDCDGMAFDVDGDRSGIDDCDDLDARRHPGAKDVPQNGLDEDCRGGDAPFPPIGTAINIQYVPGARGRIVASLLLNRVPKAARIQVRCNGRGCPKQRFAKKTVRFKRKLQLRRVLKHRQLRVGATVEVRVLKAEMLGRVRRDKLGKHRVKVARLCLDPRQVGQPLGSIDRRLSPRPERPREQCF